MAISGQVFLEKLKDERLNFVTGVPDSLLAPFLSWIENDREISHFVAANEGNAVGVAIGHHLATGGVPVVYMQNSGLGNAVNPLISLAHEEIYSIPMLLLIGWRGRPGISDEPQHSVQGRITLLLLDLLEIPYEILQPADSDLKCLKKLAEISRLHSRPTALVIQENLFDASGNKYPTVAGINREVFLTEISRISPPRTAFICTTGKSSRELYEVRQKLNMVPSDFLVVGGMGHASSIALGVSVSRPDCKVVCIDGDGALIMHMGSAAVIASVRPQNLIHIVLNNGSHESVGGQPTVGREFSLIQLAETLGYENNFKIETADQIELIWNKALKSDGLTFIEVVVGTGSRANLGRPEHSSLQIKEMFMKVIQKEI